MGGTSDLLGTLLPAVAAGGAGACAGAGARVLLRRMRRGTRIPPPWCELGVAGLWAATAVAVTAGALAGRWVPAVLALGWLVVAAGAVDLRHRRLPDALTLPALPAALALLLPVGPQAALRGVGGAVAAVAVHAAVHLADRRAVGAGDVKLAAPLGAVLAAVAWPALALAALLAALLTAAAAVTAVAGAAHGARTVPHGPSMLVACWLVAVVLLALGAGGGGATGWGGAVG